MASVNPLRSKLLVKVLWHEGHICWSGGGKVWENLEKKQGEKAFKRKTGGKKVGKSKNRQKSNINYRLLYKKKDD